MRYNPYVYQVNTVEALEAKAAKYLDKWVRATTYTDTVWYVRHAYVNHGVVRLQLVSEDGTTFWHSDNEHATIVPGYNPPIDEPAMDPNTRLLIEDE